jgi:hypothetical protein
MRALWLALLAGVALLAAAPAGACGCGVALEADITTERALVIDRGGREEIIASFDLQPEGVSRSAIVIPVPADPQVEEVPSGDPLTYLDIATAAPAGGSEEDTATAGAGVDVIGRDVIGGYDVSRLRADDTDALATWLADNGYAMPQGAEPILDGYVEEGWRYVAVRLAPGAWGRLKPLRISFDTEELVYPMRLSQLATAPLDLTLYVLSDVEQLVDGLEVEWSGPVSDLRPPPPPDVAPILRAGRHLTKLTATAADPSRFDEDIVIGGTSGAEGAPGWGPPVAILLALAGLGLLGASRRA